eukprot:4190225-Prymnesium_polylepis.1
MPSDGSHFTQPRTARAVVRLRTNARTSANTGDALSVLTKMEPVRPVAPRTSTRRGGPTGVGEVSAATADEHSASSRQTMLRTISCLTQPKSAECQMITGLRGRTEPCLWPMADVVAKGGVGSLLVHVA